MARMDNKTRAKCVLTFNPIKQNIFPILHDLDANLTSKHQLIKETFELLFCFLNCCSAFFTVKQVYCIITKTAFNKKCYYLLVHHKVYVIPRLKGHF